MSVPLDGLYFQRLQSPVSYPSEKPRSQALQYWFEVDIEGYVRCIPQVVNNILHLQGYAQVREETESLQVLDVGCHLQHVYCEWVTLCKYITCTSLYVYDFLVGPNIPVIVGVTVGLGVPLLIAITVAVAVACLVRYDKQKE